VWADAGGRSNLIDGWLWWWWGGGGFIFQFVIDVCNRRKKKEHRKTRAVYLSYVIYLSVVWCLHSVA
jgi:hypothetical protein